MDGDIWLTLGMVSRPWSSSRLSCRERLLLRCDGNARNSLLTTQGKDTYSRERDGYGVPLDVAGTLVLPLECRRDVGELLELQQGCEGPFGSSKV